MVSKLAHVEQIVGQTGHEFSGFVVIVKAVRQGFHMMEKIGAHLPLHPNAHDVAVVLHKEIAPHTGKVNAQEDGAHNGDHFVFLIGNILVQHPARDHGIQHPDTGNKQCGKHIHAENKPVRTIITDKSF